MGIGTVQQTNYRTDYAGYTATVDVKTDSFYGGLSAATEKADGKGAGDVLGLTMLPYNETTSYGMSAFYSENSTPADPVIRINCNYGGENRYFDVHVNEVNPQSASQLEMFALSCYQDDKGITDGGTFGSYSKMKTYAGNAAALGYAPDLQNPESAALKLNWVSILNQMAQTYLQTPQTYAQYLDCRNLADKLDNWSRHFNHSNSDSATNATENKVSQQTEPSTATTVENIDTPIVKEKSVASLPDGISFYFDEETHEVTCVDDKNPASGRNILWSKSLTEEQFTSCDKLFARYKGENTWIYKYSNYLAQESFWDMFISGELDLENLTENK